MGPYASSTKKSTGLNMVCNLKSLRSVLFWVWMSDVTVILLGLGYYGVALTVKNTQWRICIYFLLREKRINNAQQNPQKL